MATKKTTKGAGFSELRNAVKNGEPENIYIFYGEEAYLRSCYVEEIKQ